MRVLVSGSREWRDEGMVRVALGHVASYQGPHTLVHGDQGDLEGTVGLDRMAGRLAASIGWDVQPYAAEWRRFRGGAGPKRNQLMVDLGADLLLAFPLPGSTGTWDCIQRADDAGIPVVIVGMARWGVELKKALTTIMEARV